VGATQEACGGAGQAEYRKDLRLQILRSCSHSIALYCRFFCGPNAKKSAALAKQQKKRPRGDDKGKGKQAADADSDEDSAVSDTGAHQDFCCLGRHKVLSFLTGPY